VPPSLQLAALPGGEGVTLRIRDAASYDVSVLLTNCKLAGTRGNISCRSTDRKVSALFRIVVGPFLGQYSYATSVTISGMTRAMTGVAAPLGPLSVEVHQGLTVTRSDVLGDLLPCVRSSTTLRCK
jgi:hypothetical protein